MPAASEVAEGAVVGVEEVPEVAPVAEVAVGAEVKSLESGGGVPPGEV